MADGKGGEGSLVGRLFKPTPPAPAKPVEKAAVVKAPEPKAPDAKAPATKMADGKGGDHSTLLGHFFKPTPPPVKPVEKTAVVKGPDQKAPETKLASATAPPEQPPVAQTRPAPEPKKESSLFSWRSRPATAPATLPTAQSGPDDPLQRPDLYSKGAALALLNENKAPRSDVQPAGGSSPPTADNATITANVPAVSGPPPSPIVPSSTIVSVPTQLVVAPPAPSDRSTLLGRLGLTAGAPPSVSVESAPAPSPVVGAPSPTPGESSHPIVGTPNAVVTMPPFSGGRDTLWGRLGLLGGNSSGMSADGHETGLHGSVIPAPAERATLWERAVLGVPRPPPPPPPGKVLKKPPMGFMVSLPEDEANAFDSPTTVKKAGHVEQIAAPATNPTYPYGPPAPNFPPYPPGPPATTPWMTANGPSYAVNQAMLPQGIPEAQANAFTLATPTQPIPADFGRVPRMQGAFEDPLAGQRMASMPAMPPPMASGYPQAPMMPPYYGQPAMMPVGYGQPVLPPAPMQPVVPTGRYLPASVPEQTHLPVSYTEPMSGRGQLLATLRDSLYPSERELAVDALRKCDWRQEPMVVEALVKSAKGDPAPAVRAACVRTLGQMRANLVPVVTAIGALRSDPDLRVRQAATEALGSLMAP
jgi:hypothetical protein